jgi:acetamidase/formamidase
MADGAVAVKIQAVDVVTPGIVVYGAYTAPEPLEWWDDESACDIYPVQNGVLRFDDRTTLPTRPLIGCLAVAPAEGTVHAKLQGRYGGNLDCRELRAGATAILPWRTTAEGSTSATARR